MRFNSFHLRVCFFFFFSQIGLTPLHIAADKGHADFVRVLVTKYNAIVDLATVVRLVYIAIKEGRFFQL